MSRNHFAALLLVLSGLACDATPRQSRELEPEERKLADLYVRLTLLEALREQNSDSVNVRLDSIRAHFDSVAVHRALDELSQDPLRWELVFDVIATTLSELEKDPEQWWSKVSAESSLVGPSESEPARDR